MTRFATGCSWLAAGLALAAAGARAQEARERVVRVNVTSVSARSVFLDRGRDSGIEIGAIVQLFPPGVASLDVEVRAVSSTSARAEVPPGLPLPPIGTSGEVRVTPRGERVEAAREPRAVPDHPPWTRTEDPRSPDQPLLVPAFRRRPDERPATFDGRWFGSAQWSRDEADGGRGEYALGRLGLRADATNHLGFGERVRMAGELDARLTLLPDAPDERDATGRLDLLSVSFGTEEWAPTGAEFGRFHSRYLPEIGLVDGVEVVRRYQGGIHIGAGVGAYPRPFPARATGDDVGSHVFLGIAGGADHAFEATVGFQKTWHRGTPDRDLALLRLSGRISERAFVFASAKVDLYTGSDDAKGRGVELTEAMGSVRWDGDALGTGLSLTHFTWPELLRAEYQALPVELVRDGVVDRASWSGWVRPWRPLRARARIDAWRDQDRDGSSWSLGADLRDLVGSGSRLSADVFHSDGGFSSGPGARIDLHGLLQGGRWRAGYRWHRYSLAGLATGEEGFDRESAQLGLAVPVGHGGDVDLVVERWFGDREDAWSAGVYVQWRF